MSSDLKVVLEGLSEIYPQDDWMAMNDAVEEWEPMQQRFLTRNQHRRWDTATHFLVTQKLYSQVETYYPKLDKLHNCRIGDLSHLHCASHPCRLTAPVSSDKLVSGNFWAAHGLPANGLNTSSSSDAFNAPSWSRWVWKIIAHTKSQDTLLKISKISVKNWYPRGDRKSVV